MLKAVVDVRERKTVAVPIVELPMMAGANPAGVDKWSSSSTRS